MVKVNCMYVNPTGKLTKRLRKFSCWGDGLLGKMFFSVDVSSQFHTSSSFCVTSIIEQFLLFCCFILCIFPFVFLCLKLEHFVFLYTSTATLKYVRQCIISKGVKLKSKQETKTYGTRGYTFMHTNKQTKTNNLNKLQNWYYQQHKTNKSTLRTKCSITFDERFKRMGTM